LSIIAEGVKITVVVVLGVSEEMVTSPEEASVDVQAMDLELRLALLTRMLLRRGC
jgi:hypothetical protein